MGVYYFATSMSSDSNAATDKKALFLQNVYK